MLLPRKPIQLNTISTSQGSIQPCTKKTIRTQISTTVYSHALIVKAEWTGAI